MSFEESPLAVGLLVELVEVGRWPFEKGKAIGEILFLHLLEVEVVGEQIDEFLQERRARFGKRGTDEIVRTELKRFQGVEFGDDLFGKEKAMDERRLVFERFQVEPDRVEGFFDQFGLFLRLLLAREPDEESDDAHHTGDDVDQSKGRSHSKQRLQLLLLGGGEIVQIDSFLLQLFFRFSRELQMIKKISKKEFATDLQRRGTETEEKRRTTMEMHFFLV